jgi:hypothetical protein
MSKRPILDYFEAEQSKPKLYSRELIFVFTLIFSVLFGAILYVYNLRAVGKQHRAISVTVVAVFYYGISEWLISHIPLLPFLPTLLINLLAGIILIEPAWKQQIGMISYQKKSPLYPLLFAILIAFGWLIARQTAYGLIG